MGSACFIWSWHFPHCPLKILCSSISFKVKFNLLTLFCKVPDHQDPGTWPASFLSNIILSVSSKAPSTNSQSFCEPLAPLHLLDTLVLLWSLGFSMYSFYLLYCQISNFFTKFSKTSLMSSLFGHPSLTPSSSIPASIRWSPLKSWDSDEVDLLL
jgi:hypothetical protein